MQDDRPLGLLQEYVTHEYLTELIIIKSNMCTVLGFNYNVYSGVRYWH